MQIYTWLSAFASLTSAAAIQRRDGDVSDRLCIARAETCHIARPECCNDMLCFLDFDSYQTNGPSFKCQTLQDSLQNLGRAFDSVLSGLVSNNNGDASPSSIELQPPLSTTTIATSVFLPPPPTTTSKLITPSSFSNTSSMSTSLSTTTTTIDVPTTRIPIPEPIITPTATWDPVRFSSVEIPIPTIEPSFPPLTLTPASPGSSPTDESTQSPPTIAVTSDFSVVPIIPPVSDLTDGLTDVVPSSIDNAIVPLPSLTPLQTPDILDIFGDDNTI